MPERGLSLARRVGFAWRLLRRDLSSGRLLIMLLAATLAVASTVSVNLLVTRVEQTMLAESSALLAGDLALVTREPSPDGAVADARRHGLDVARTVSLRSVVAVGEALQLVQLKAVDDAYPLRGRLLVAPALHAATQPAVHGPPAGEVWADARLFQLLDLEVGAEISIGAATLRLTRLLALEPDRGGDVFSLAPRVMMNLADLPATGLIVPGSRARWTLLVAGAPAAVADFRDALETTARDEIVDPRGARPEMEAAFTQAGRFLGLAAFAGVLLAAIGIALAAGALHDHHERTVAVLKTLGSTRGEVRWLLGLEILLLALLATVLGDSVAWAVHTLLLSELVPGAAQLPSGRAPWLPLLHGLWVACVVLLGFALPVLVRLGKLPVMAILKRDRAGLPPTSPGTLLGMLATLALIAPWHGGEPRLVGLALAGMFGAGLLLALGALVLVRLLGGLRQRTAMSWRFGLANIARRARLSVVQTTAVGLGLAVILLLGLVRDDLVGQWQARLPPRAPNVFLINIQADEVTALRDFLADQGHHDVTFYPMVRGRLVTHNDVPVELDAYDSARARRLADREFNLSWATTLKPDNRIVGGHWWTATATGELSVEQGLARLLGIALGDTLEFSVADRVIRGRVTSLRALEWDNFEVNFFVVTTPELLHAAPATYITSFHLPVADSRLMVALVRAFPSVTVIDVEAVMQQIRQVMTRVASALGWVFGFALAAGLLVLAAAVQASQRERRRDVVLLKTLGASRRFITLTALLEFVLLGALAGALGSLGAIATAWLLAEYVFDLAYAPAWQIPVLGLAAGIGSVTALGAVVVWRTHRQAVIAVLRASV